MTKLSVNLNKIAWLRNARHSNLPNLLDMARVAIQAGANGITVHPRPDQRHITKQDVQDLAALIAQYKKDGFKIEFNVEGYPSDDFVALMLEVKPDQCTLVPDAPEQLMSDHGWNLRSDFDLVASVTDTLQAEKIRVAIFLEPDETQIELAKEAGADRIELYTSPYAEAFNKGEQEKILSKYVKAAEAAKNLIIGINAGRDFNLNNLSYFVEKVPNLLEISIGHSLISDALLLGLENSVRAYLDCVSVSQSKEKTKQ